MASGLMHTQTSIMLSAAVVPYYGLDRPELAVTAILAGLWAVLVQPDLDQLDNGGVSPSDCGIVEALETA